MNKKIYTIHKSASIREALVSIRLNKIGMVFVVDDDEKVIGVATDGDIRSSLIEQVSLSDSISLAFNSDFVWKKTTDQRESILKLLDSRIKAIPILDENKKLVDITTSNQFPLGLEEDIFAQSKAPVRLSFAGGGSDLTDYFMKEQGAVINATISLYCHASLKLRSDKRIIIDSMDLNKTIEYRNLKDLITSKDSLGLFRSLIKLIQPEFGFELAVYSDFPLGSGLGGSSAVMIAVCGCFNEFRRDKWDQYELAELAFQAERLDMNVAGGWQDQYATVFGGFNFIEFRNDNNLIHPLRLSKKTLLDLEENLILFKISSGRKSGLIHEDQKNSMKDKEIQDLVKKNVSQSYNMRDFLLRGKLDQFGQGLHTAWKFKRKLSKKISNNYLDNIYDYATKNGALGGKLLGAGGGGFFIFYVPTFSKTFFLRAMAKKKLSQTIFSFDNNGMRSWSNRNIKNKVKSGSIN